MWNWLFQMFYETNFKCNWNIYMKKIVQIYSKLILFWRSSPHEFKYIRNFSNEHLVQKIWIIRNIRMKIKCMSSAWGERMHACTVLSSPLSLLCKSWLCQSDASTCIHVLPFIYLINKTRAQISKMTPTADAWPVGTRSGKKT